MGLVTGQGRPECSHSGTLFKAKLTRFDGAREGAVVHPEVAQQTKGIAEKLGFSQAVISDACFPQVCAAVLATRAEPQVGGSSGGNHMPLYLCHAQKADSSSTLW